VEFTHFPPTRLGTIPCREGDAMQGKLRAAMVTDVGGIGDESFNASAWRGLQRAQKELGAEVRYLESRTAADYVRNLTTLARQGFSVVFRGRLSDGRTRWRGSPPASRRSTSALWTARRPTCRTACRWSSTSRRVRILVGALAGAMTKAQHRRLHRRDECAAHQEVRVRLPRRRADHQRAGARAGRLHGQLGRCEQGA
jgi:hypothetical protein